MVLPISLFFDEVSFKTTCGHAMRFDNRIHNNHMIYRCIKCNAYFRDINHYDHNCDPQQVEPLEDKDMIALKLKKPKKVETISESQWVRANDYQKDKR